MKTILIAIPTNKYIEPETFKSIYDLEIPEGYITKFQFFYGYQVDQIRNLIAEWAKHYDYLFSVDSDIVLPKDSLRKMLIADKDIISGLYIQRHSDRHILEVYAYYEGVYRNISIAELDEHSLVEIAACGMGCALIKSEVFRNLTYPHFVYKPALDHKDTFSEDIYFCDYARKHGFSVWIDTTIRCAHIGSTTYTVQEHPLTKLASADLLPKEHSDFLKNLDIEPKVIYDIGASVLHWTNKAKERWPEANIHLFDATSSVKPILHASGFSYYSGVLSDKDGKVVKFYQNLLHPGGNSYYKENTNNYVEEMAIEKTTYTLDTIVKNNNWPLPDLIKLDIQGAELDVLKGAVDCLEYCNYIILEAQHSDYNIGAPKIEEVVNWLKLQGFVLKSTICKNDIDGDYYFLKESISN